MASIPHSPRRTRRGGEKRKIMAIIKVQKGTKDILPSDMPVWHFMEEKANEVFSRYGAKEIRTPIFEATELFARGVGDTPDIVNKDFLLLLNSGTKVRCSVMNVLKQVVKDSFIRLAWKFLV